MECFYFAFGKSDAIVIADFPDSVTAVAVGIAINAAGTVQGKSTVLFTPEDIDNAVKKTINYRPPGK